MTAFLSWALLISIFTLCAIVIKMIALTHEIKVIELEIRKEEHILKSDKYTLN